MSKIFTIPYPEKDQPAVLFPQICNSCGAPKEAESNLMIGQLEQTSRTSKRKPQNDRFQIPHCKKCAQSTKVVFLAGLIPFLLGFVIVGCIAFVIGILAGMYWDLDDIGQPGSFNSLVLGASAGLFAGLAGGFVFELASRIILLPFLGTSLLRAPLLGSQLLGDSDFVAGISVKPDRKSKTLKLTFHNERVAANFATINKDKIKSGLGE